MSKATSNKSEPIGLHWPKRWAAYIVTMLLFGCAVWLTVFPPIRTVVELGAEGTQSKATRSPAEMGQTVLVLLIASGGLYLYGLNGFRFNRIATPSASAESELTTKAAEDHYTKSSASEPVEIDRPNEDAPTPAEPPLASIPIGSEDFGIYALAALPMKVLNDMLQYWPKDLAKPPDMSSFEFASRKKGNHPWTVKFRGLQPLTIAYGGQGKAAPSINPGEQ